MIQGDPRRYVDDEGEDTGPHDAVVQGLLLGREFEDQFTVLDSRCHSESAGDGYPRTRHVCHVVSIIDMSFRC